MIIFIIYKKNYLNQYVIKQYMIEKNEIVLIDFRLPIRSDRLTDL
jgi:hypothetical protein